MFGSRDQLRRSGWYRSIGVKTMDNCRIRALLTARVQLVAIRTRLSNQIGGPPKTFGIALGAASVSSRVSPESMMSAGGYRASQVSISSLAFVAAIEDPLRFRRSVDLDRMMRSLLFETANAVGTHAASA